MAGGKVVDAQADGVGAGGLQGIVDGGGRVHAAELGQHGVEAAEHGEIDIQAQRRHVTAIAVLDADRRALGQATVREGIRVVGDHLVEVGIGRARQPQLGSRLAHAAPGQVVMDRQNGVFGLGQVMQHHFAERRQRLAQAIGHLLELGQQVLVFGSFFHPNILSCFRLFVQYLD